MKKIFWIVSLIAASCTWSFAQDQNNQVQNDETYYNDDTYNEEQSDNSGMSYQTFYDELSPYGSWINYPGYGYVWVPQANEGFSPYMSDGQWQYTDYGWTWVSDYAWGWATFHYGRWFMDPDYGGWLWIPGYDWAPAWVNWGMYGDYYCWTPIGPRDYVNGRWGYGSYPHHWNCVPQGHMGEPGVSRYVVTNDVVNHDRGAFERGVTMVNHTNTYGRSVFNAGPRVEDVQRVVGHPITKLAINNTSKPEKTGIHGTAINIYRPNVSRSAPQQHAVPGKLINPSEIPHSNNTNTEHSNNNAPAHQPMHNNNTNTEPARNSNFEPSRSEPSHNSWTPPRQNAPRPEPQQPRQSEPIQRNNGGFIPSERPSMPERSAPMPSFHASPAPSGGGRGGGGGRHF